METIKEPSRQATLMKIKEIYPKLPRGQKLIADYVLEHPDDVVKLSISELTARTNLKSEASVVKFYRMLGFSGYKEFKLELAQERVSRTFYHSYDDITLDDPACDVRRKVLSGAIATLSMNLEMVDPQPFSAAIDLLRNAKRIIFLGHAASAAICYYADFRFTELGLNCHFSPDSHITATVLAQPNPGDVIFCISHSGETADLIHMMRKASERNVPIILLTGHKDSTLAKMADPVLLTTSDETNLMTDAMNSRVVQLCLIDALFSAISVAEGDQMVPRLMNVRRVFFDYRNNSRGNLHD